MELQEAGHGGSERVQGSDRDRPPPSPLCGHHWPVQLSSVGHITPCCHICRVGHYYVIIPTFVSSVATPHPLNM